MTDNEPNDPRLNWSAWSQAERDAACDNNKAVANSPTPIAARSATSAKALAMHPKRSMSPMGPAREPSLISTRPRTDRPLAARAQTPPDQVLSVLDQRSVISFWQQPPTARNSQRRPPTQAPNDGAGLRLLGPETLDPNADQLPALPRMRREPAPRRYPPFNS
jgi:hypothetical protein